MGRGEGAGDGSGEGAGGAPSEEGMVAGGALGAGLAIFFCVCGFPMIITGVILVAFFKEISGLFDAGIALLVISGVLLVGGIILIVLLCTGVIGKKNTVNQAGPAHVIIAPTGGYGQPPGYAQPGYGQSQQPPAYAQQPPAYGADPAYPPGGSYPGGPSAPPK